RPVAFAIGWRAIQALIGVGSIVIIPRFYTKDLQGYYYTFSSLVALTSLVELGLHAVIVNVASHEWSRLGLAPRDVSRPRQGIQIVGDPIALSRLISLGRQVCAWYSGVSIIAWLALSAAGWVFFSRSDSSTVAWRGPWLVLCLITALQLWVLPFMTLL